MSSTTPYALQNNRIHVVNPPEALNKLAGKRKETRGNGSYPKYNFKYNGGASTITPIPRLWHRQYKISHPAVHRQCIFPSRHPSTSRPAPAPQSGLRTSHIAHRTTPVATCVSCQSSVNRVRARRNREIEGHYKRADYPLAPSESFYAKGCRLAGCPRSTLRRSLSWNRFVEAHSFVIATGHCRNEQSTTDGLLIDQLVHCKQASVRVDGSLMGTTGGIRPLKTSCGCPAMSHWILHRHMNDSSPTSRLLKRPVAEIPVRMLEKTELHSELYTLHGVTLLKANGYTLVTIRYGGYCLANNTHFTPKPDENEFYENIFNSRSLAEGINNPDNIRIA
ncbi:hypothetical protein QR685DRAFT_584815 [Neurospora intermedia]|uniref:Uncharacterized protein n=1 Tax=Neurospora intermedia TaxID=5142 RepID=A0ABR3CX96_NEUIN